MKTILAAAALLAVAAPAFAGGPACAPIVVPALEIAAVDCTAQHVWQQLQASGQFPDVFAGSGKMTPVCYASTGPASGTVGGVGVVIASSISGWTTDFTPVLFGGTDNLGTVVTQLNFADRWGHIVGRLYTRDTIDLSQIFVTGTSAEEDVAVGGDGVLFGAKGTYRMVSTPENPAASKVAISGLHGELCLGGP